MPESIPTDPARLAALARNVTTSLATLEQLAKSDLTFIREDVARHPNATGELLLRLVPTTLENEADRRVAAAVVSNPLTPGPALLAVARLLPPERLDGSRRENWPWEDLAVATLSHANFPVTDAVRLIQSTHLSNDLKVRLAERRPNKGILDLLSEDRSEKVCMAAAAASNYIK